MKKILFIFGLSLCFIAISCSKSEENSELDNNMMSSKVSNVLNENSTPEKKLMYSLLNKDEKKIFWIKTLETIISKNNLNKNQINLINELKNNINSDIFNESSNNDKREIFKNRYVNEFINKAKVLFTHNQINSIFFDANSKLYDSTPVCNCNGGSIFACGDSYQCKETSCKLKVHDCGFLWMFDCDGECKTS